MFSRKSCYCFVRPKKSFLEVCVFLPRGLKHPKVRRANPASKTKVANMMRIVHRDEVEAPFTDWLLEAYEYSGATSARPVPKSAATRAKRKARATPKPRSKPKPRTKLQRRKQTR